MGIYSIDIYCGITTQLEVAIVKEKIEAVLDEIRPNLQADGGDVEFVGFEDGIVKVRLKGACAGCPMSQITLAMGIERVLKEKISEVEKVEAVPF
jgi:Fe-S cluster biogenesis protein NfuA